ncbi:MAG: hypothetical protein LBB25_02850, partial [Holosporaceae bacterium]|nr:hypothetical protein [Holosporaceae bacterium]
MNFFSNAVRLIYRKKKNQTQKIEENHSLSKTNLELEFPLRNYAKESFSVLIVKPLSLRILKIMRVTSLIIMVISAVLLVTLICFMVFLKFGPVENTFVSTLIQSKL